MILRCLFLLAGLAWATTAVAGPVSLTTRDGSLTLEGELLSWDGEYYRLETEFGALTLGVAGVSCEGKGCPGPSELVVRVRVAGSGDMVHRLLPALLEGFASREELSLIGRNSDDSSVRWEVSDAQEGKLLAVFEATADEGPLRQLAARNVDISLGTDPAQGTVRQDVIALDAVVSVVAAENARAMVSAPQLSGLLTGRLASWSSLGGPDASVTLHLPRDAERLPSLVNPSAPFAKAEFHTDGQKLAQAVARDPTALGIASYSMIGTTVPLVIGGRCGLAVPATRDTIRTADYPLTRPIFLQRLGSRQPRILRDFIAYARSEDAHAVVRGAGFVDQAIGRIGFDRQGDRVANAILSAGNEPASMAAVRDMVGILMSMDRLTVSFRFDGDSGVLDPQSGSNVRHLADAIENGGFDGEAIVLAGFTDGVGASDENLRLSQKQVEAVRRSVESLLDGPAARFESVAFGEAMPLACDDTPWGRRTNRRVEVWVRQR